MPSGAQAPTTPDELTIMSKYDPRACALENVKFQTDEQMGLKAVPRIAAPKPPRGGLPAVAASPKYAADFARGYTEANARIAAIVGDARVKGHERAAIDLAIAAPAMSVEALSAFVGDHAAGTSGAALSSVRFGSLSALQASPESKTSSDGPGKCGGLAAAVSGLIGNDQL